MTNKDKFIGSGMIFPIVINEHGRPDIINDLRLIRASILTILNWARGTRYFNETFGSRVENILEEPDDSITKSLLRLFIQESLGQWEKRITINNIQLLNNSDSNIDARLFYTIKNTKTEDVMIYPFYKNIKH